VLRACSIDRLFWEAALTASGKGYSAVGSSEEPSCCQSCSQRFGLVKKLFLSKLEILDGLSDGLALLVAFDCDAKTSLRWANSFSAPDLVRGALASMGPGVMLAVILLYATFIQYPSRDQPAYMTAMVAGLGLAEEAGSADESERGFVHAMLRTLPEAGPQLIAQTALLAAVGESLATQPVLLFSTLMSIATVLTSALGLAKFGLGVFKEVDGEGFAFVLLSVFGTMGIAAMAVLGTLRLIGIEACASRTWTVSGGCLPPSALTA